MRVGIGGRTLRVDSREKCWQRTQNWGCAWYANSKESGKPGKNGCLTLQNDITKWYHYGKVSKSALQKTQLILVSISYEITRNKSKQPILVHSQIMFFSNLDRRVWEALRWNLGCVYQQWTSQGKKGKNTTVPFQLAGWHPGKEPMFSCFWWC